MGPRVALLVLATLAALAVVSADMFSPTPRAQKPSRMTSSSRNLHFLATKEPQPLKILAQVNVVMIGFNEDGGQRYSYPASDLEEALMTSMPTHKISCAETGEQMNVEFEMAFHVTTVPNTYDKVLERMLTYSNKRDTNNMPIFNVEAQGTEEYFDSVLEEIAAGKKGAGSASRGRYGKGASAFFEPDGFTIIIVNPEKRNMMPKGFMDMHITEGDFNYRYSYGGESYTQTWISSNKYVVVDISAGPCEYGSVNTGEGTVSEGTIPSLEGMKSAGAAADSSSSMIAFRGAMVSVIMNAVERVFLPDIKNDHVDVPEQVIVPVVVLRNHNKFDPVDPAGKDADYYVDIEFIRKEVERILLPHQKLVLSSGVHSLHSHKHISMSVATALKSDSIHEASDSGSYVLKTSLYLDSAILINQMKGAAEILAANYEGMRHSRANLPPNPSNYRYEAGGSGAKQEHLHDSSRDFMRDNESGGVHGQFPESHGTRVVPVYVFSLGDVPEDVLFDHEDVVVATSSSVLVVQTDADSAVLPYISDRVNVQSRPRDVNRHIVAGIAQALGGVTPPHVRYSQFHRRLVTDHMWSVGHHPFGPFSSTRSLPKVMVESVVRNSILSRVSRAVRSARQAVRAVDDFAMEYIVDSFDDTDHSETHDENTWLDHIYETSAGWFGLRISNGVSLAPGIIIRLHDMVEKLEADFMIATDSIFNFHEMTAYELSSTLVITAEAFNKYTLEELERARLTLECCTTHIAIKSSSDSWMTYGLALVGVVFVAILVLMCGDASDVGGRRRSSIRRQ